MRIKNLFLVFTFCGLALVSGCAQKGSLARAKDYIRESQNYYQKAIGLYKGLISQGKDLDRLHFELGELYFSHGEFVNALEEFKNTRDARAKKFLALSYYRLGNFTDALEIFNQEDSSDAEHLYYQGLTCEKLNLFDQALGIYKKIQSGEFSAMAQERVNVIEKESAVTHIKDLDPVVFKILEGSPTAEEYPQAGALILLCDEKIEVTPQNTQVSTLHYIIKILNERGKENFSESKIGYDSTYEKVELEYARTIKPDGEVREVGSRHIRDVSKYLNFPLYSNARVYIISFPEIAEGAVVEYKVKIYDNQLINKKDFVLNYPVQSSEPIITASFNIDVPKEKPLFIKTLNEKYNNFGAHLAPQIQQKDSRLIYSWLFKDIPQIIPESNMPANVQINPTMLISTFSNWQDIYNWWWPLAKDKITADIDIKEKVNQLIKGLNEPEAKLRAISNFCSQKIRYVAVEYGQAGYEPHKAEDIFKNKYGDCKDQAILLVTMLREAGFSAWPVLISTKEYYNLHPDFPALLFNHCIAAVSLGEKIIFLDPTAETCSFGDLPIDDQDRRVLIIQENGYKIHDTPLYPAGHNLIKQYLKIKANEDETIIAKRSIFTYGIYDQSQRYWMLYTPPELIQESLKEKIQGISIGATLDSYDIKNLEDLNLPVVLGYEFKGPEYFTAAGKLRIMPQLASLDTSLVAKAKRRYPIDFSALDIKETIFELEIPAGFIINYMPTSVSEESPWFKFIVEYNYHDNKIYFSQKTELKKNIVSEEEYPDFKASLEGLAKKIKERVILEKTN